MSYKIEFPLSWDENLPCGCIEHVTDTGCGFIEKRDLCEHHKESLELMKLEYDQRFKVVRCMTCGCPSEICTCATKSQDGN